MDNNNSNCPENLKQTRLQSTIINQKKKLFLYVTQSKDLVWPNKTYDYQIYVKNISGQTIKNLNIYITNPKEVVIRENDVYTAEEYDEIQPISSYLEALNCVLENREFDIKYQSRLEQILNKTDILNNELTSQDIEIINNEIRIATFVMEKEEENQHTYKIPTLKSGQSVLINVNDCLIMQEGYYHVNFVAMGDETEIKTQSLMIKCGYENDNKNILHRIAFYNFSPYESAYMQRASDFSENVTQLTKIQTKPFEAYNQPFEMDTLELDLYAQDIFLTNTDDMPSMYLGRENWESNLKEGFVGQSLFNLIQKINQESDLVEIDFLRTGNNEMFTDLQQIFPNGFIHRFGLLKSEFYKLLGIIPKIYSINDDLFRWARSENEPIIYPKRENDKWNQKPWCGTGYYVYESKIENNKKLYTIEKAIFTTKEDAEFYVNNLNTFNSLHFIEDIIYEIKKRDWLPGIFYVEIPLRDIPANFYIPDIDQIQAVIELVKPYGLKGYPRFVINNEFIHKMEFSAIPTISPHINIDLSEDDTFINYHIRQKKYQKIIENNTEIIRLQEYGLQAEKINFGTSLLSFFNYAPKPSICETFTQTIKYFLEDNNIYAHIYPVGRAEELRSANITTIKVSQEDLLNIFASDAMNVYGLHINAPFQLIEEEELLPNEEEEENQEQEQEIGEEITPEETQPDIIYQETIIYMNDIYNNVITLPEDFLVVVNSPDTDEKYNLMNMTENFTVTCNSQGKSFDGKIIDKNSLNNLLMKNPEDISFYLINNNIFGPTNVTVAKKALSIPVKYKTLDYYDEETSMVLDLTEQNKAPSTIKLLKQNLPPHVNINLLLSNVANTQDFIISYKLLYDNVYQISYKTHKKTEVVIKEIATEFDYILCDINHISSNKDLIKIYYGLDDKIYFITSFVANILQRNGYKLRVALTNDLTLSSKFNFSNGNLIFGNMKYSEYTIKEFDDTQQKYINKKVQEYPNWYLANKQYSSIINTDNYQIKEIPKSTMLWKNLYRINKDETSFALFENKTSEKTSINSLELFLTDLNLPQNSIIDKIYLDIYADSREEITMSSSYQTNTNITNNVDNISGIFNIKSYQIYTKNNLRYLYKQLAYYQEKDNENQIEHYKQLIDTYNRQNADINTDFSATSPIHISNNYWNEVDFDNINNLQTADVKKIYLIIEGYNKSNNVELESQLAYYDGIGNPTKINIDSGYFYKKIPINYDNKYNINDLSIRFKFNNVQNLDLYNVKAEINFTTKQNIITESLDGESIFIDGLDKYSCFICKDIDADTVLDGLTIKLDFNDIQNYLKIYSVIVNIIYHEKAFTNIIETSPDFNTVSATESNGLFRCNVFDEKVSDMRQDNYTTKKPNGEYDAGFELNNRIYQAFIAEEDNITSIELKPNGKIGAPDNYLKVAILDNYDNLPNNVLKEVIIDITKNKLLDDEAYKYNIYVDNLIIGNTYWFSIEPMDKTKQGARRFFYNNYQIGDFKLLSINHGDVINQHASLYFRLYSKQNNYAFEQLPFKFEIDNNYTKDINLITEIQVYDGYIKNLEQSYFGECPKVEIDDEDDNDNNNNDDNNDNDAPNPDETDNSDNDIIDELTEP